VLDVNGKPIIIKMDTENPEKNGIDAIFQFQNKLGGAEKPIQPSAEGEVKPPVKKKMKKPFFI
jgi:hypothetical protein